MLSSGNLIQQNKAQGRITDDPKDLCIYVDHCNGTSASVLGQQALSNRLTMDQTSDVRSVFWYVCGHLFLCDSKNKPPAMQGEGRSLDISMSSCAIIEVGLQNHK